MSQEQRNGEMPPVDDLFPGARGSDGWLDLCGCDLRNKSLAGHSLIRVRFGDEGREKGSACVVGVSFRGSLLEEVDFRWTRLEANDFRGSTLDRCDFRFAVFARTTLADSDIFNCDFYRAHFESGNLFDNAHLTRISLDKAWLQGISGLERSTFEKRHGPPALIHEANDEAYKSFLERTEKQRLKKRASGASARDTIPDALARKRIVAAETYRGLSGLWTTQGRLEAATFAYARSKDFEREHHRLRLVNRLRRKQMAPDPHEQSGWSEFWKFVGLTVARWTCHYGEDLRLIALWMVLLVLVPGTLYALLGGVEGADGREVDSWSKCVLFSLQQVTTLSSSSLKPASQLVEFFGSSETMVGIALLGLFGFVLGNKLRNS